MNLEGAIKTKTRLDCIILLTKNDDISPYGSHRELNHKYVELSILLIHLDIQVLVFSRYIHLVYLLSVLFSFRLI